MLTHIPTKILQVFTNDAFSSIIRWYWLSSIFRRKYRWRREDTGDGWEGMKMDGCKGMAFVLEIIDIKLQFFEFYEKIVAVHDLIVAVHEKKVLS